MADEKVQVRCPNPHILATFVREIPKECLIPKHTVAGRALQVAHWIADQYHAVSPETKHLAKEVAVEAVRVGFPVASMFLNFFKE